MGFPSKNGCRGRKGRGRSSDVIDKKSANTDTHESTKNYQKLVCLYNRDQTPETGRITVINLVRRVFF